MNISTSFYVCSTDIGGNYLNAEKLKSNTPNKTKTQPDAKRKRKRKEKKESTSCLKRRKTSKDQNVKNSNPLRVSMFTIGRQTNPQSEE